VLENYTLHTFEYGQISHHYYISKEHCNKVIIIKNDFDIYIAFHHNNEAELIDEIIKKYKLSNKEYFLLNAEIKDNKLVLDKKIRSSVEGFKVTKELL
ncbi:MAG: hypothetical protein V1824_00075, partial [archaeon]